MLREHRLDRGLRVFRNPFLDWVSRAPPAVPGLLWGPLAAAALAYGVYSGLGRGKCAGLFGGGFVAWLFAEYLIHRWIFHFQPRPGRLRRLYYYIHEHHHRYQEWDRLLAPPLMSLSIGAILIAAISLTLGRILDAGGVCVFSSGLALGYLVYDYTHLYIHFARPRTRWGRFVRRCHLEHHFARPDCWFCISFPWLDYLFRTHRRNDGSMPAMNAGHAADDPADLPQLVRDFEASLATASSSIE